MGLAYLFEFEDQSWCPAVLRNAVTGYLRLVVQVTRQAGPVAPALADLLKRSGETRILDLCSGSGGIALQLTRRMAASGPPPRFLLTDLYPDTVALDAVAAQSGGTIEVLPSPLDATRVPAEMPGLRTVFNAFHHFHPAEARAILQAAAAAGRPIAVVEFIERAPFTLLGVFFSPLMMLMVAPFLRPLRWTTLVFTYLLPVIPLMVWWDALVSWLRVYSVRELEELAASVDAPGYQWEAGRWRVGPVRVTYLMGHRP